MKKISFIFVLIPCIILLSGCGRLAEPAAPLKEMPTLDELTEYRSSHTAEEYTDKMQAVQSLIDSTPYDDICDHIEASLTDWAKSQKVLAIGRVSVTFSKDDLLMNELANEKLYQNIFVEAAVYYDAEQANLTQQEIAEQIAGPAHKALRGTPWGRFKINTIDMACYDTDGGLQFSDSAGYATPSKNLIPAQPEGEYHIQTIAYDFVQEFNISDFSDESFSPHGIEKNVTLRRFGIKPEAEELYIEIPIYQLDYSADTEAFQSSLEGRSAALYHLLAADSEAMQVLKENGVRFVTVAFYTPWETQGVFHYTYRYELEVQ